MVRLAVALAFAAMLAAGLPSPGLYFALGLGIAAIGCGSAAFSRRDTSGAARLVAAGAITVGVIGVLLAALRIAIVLGAIARIDRMIG